MLRTQDCVHTERQARYHHVIIGAVPFPSWWGATEAASNVGTVTQKIALCFMLPWMWAEFCIWDDFEEMLTTIIFIYFLSYKPSVSAVEIGRWRVWYIWKYKKLLCLTSATRGVVCHSCNVIFPSDHENRCPLVGSGFGEIDWLL